MPMSFLVRFGSFYARCSGCEGTQPPVESGPFESSGNKGAPDAAYRMCGEPGCQLFDVLWVLE